MNLAQRAVLLLSFLVVLAIALFHDRTADLWIEVATNLGDNKGEVKRELSLIKNTKLAAIKTPISESELIQELLQPVIEATEP